MGTNGQKITVGYLYKRRLRGGDGLCGEEDDVGTMEVRDAGVAGYGADVGIILVVLVGGCDNMLCQNPYVQLPSGKTKRYVLITGDRSRLTPFPCGQCLACRINKSRVWKARILLEAGCYQDNSFVTLTYNDDNLPQHRSLCKPDLQKFFKRFRYYTKGLNIRYYAVGEYGELGPHLVKGVIDPGKRPHYHACLFGIGKEYESVINNAWLKGNIDLGELNNESAAYITGYITEKEFKKDDKNIGFRTPVFSVMSKMDGGIGTSAIKYIKNKTEYNKALQGSIPQVRVAGKLMPIGRYMQEKLEDGLGIPDWQRQVATYDYQQKLFDEFLEKEGIYKELLVERDKGKRMSAYIRSKRFKRRKKL